MLHIWTFWIFYYKSRPIERSVIACCLAIQNRLDFRNLVLGIWNPRREIFTLDFFARFLNLVTRLPRNSARFDRFVFPRLRCLFCSCRIFFIWNCKIFDIRDGSSGFLNGLGCLWVNSWIITSSERTSAKLLYGKLKDWTARTLKNKTLKNFIKCFSEPDRLVYKPMLVWDRGSDVDEYILANSPIWRASLEVALVFSILQWTECFYFIQTLTLKSTFSAMRTFCGWVWMAL